MFGFIKKAKAALAEKKEEENRERAEKVALNTHHVYLPGSLNCNEQDGIALL